jgi:hypothetical protein
VIVTGVVADRLPLVPVTVTVYVPGAVPSVTTFEQAFVPELPLHPLSEPKPAASRHASASAFSPLRLRLGNRNNSSPASATPDAPLPHPSGFTAALLTQLLVPPFDVIVSVDVPVPPDASVKPDGAIEQIGAVPDVGVGVTAHVSDTVPINPPVEVPVIIDMLVVVVLTVVVAVSVV